MKSFVVFHADWRFLRDSRLIQNDPRDHIIIIIIFFFFLITEIKIKII